jgi:alpha-ketoglutarate-dependent taurine dioxygenase/aryl carrier-like protein
VELGEVEAALLRHAAVREAAVAVRTEQTGDTRLVAFIVTRSDVPALDISQLRIELKKTLPEHMIPSAFVQLTQLPRLLSGKVDRQRLPEVDETTIAAVDHGPPATPVKEMLCGIWQELLRVERVGVKDNFFDLGGHSLLATQLVSRVREAFGVEIGLRELFERPTVAGWAEKVEAALRGGDSAAAPSLKAVSRERELPLSYAQQRLWFLDQLEPGSVAYNIPKAIRLSGKLELAALERTLNEVVRRHEVLRTRFVAVNGQPVQVIEAEAWVTIPVIDLSELPAEEREAQAAGEAVAEAQTRFDLSAGPLLRVKLLRLGDEDHVVLFTMHHIVSDGWSTGILVREVAALYEAFIEGRESPIEELAIQYADYAVWQREWLQGEVLERQLNYWRKQLGGELPVLQLSTDRPRPAVPTNRGATHSLMLPAELAKELKALSRREGVTLFMTLLATLQTLLSRYTGQEEVVIGADIANRTRVETEAMIGFFINLLVLRTRVRGHQSFRELLLRVRDTTLGAYAHQEVPFDKIVEHLQPERTIGRAPMIQVVLSVQNISSASLKLPDLTITPFASDNLSVAGDVISKWDLLVFLTETPDGVGGILKYSTDLFDASTIDRMSNHFTMLLSSIVANPDAPLNTLEMYTEEERSQQNMEKQRLKESRFSKFKQFTPKPVSLEPDTLVKMDLLQPEQSLPLVIEPTIDSVDLVQWVSSNRELAERKLLEHGALLFRGFNIKSAPQFEAVAQSLCSSLFGDYGDLPREGISGKVYGSTPYPAEQTILFHNESSHMQRWPLKIFFYCVQAAQEGGETPLVDCRKLYQLLDPEIRELFARKQLMYVRNFTGDLDVSWQHYFKSSDPSAVERHCRESLIDFKWKNGDGLRISQCRPAVMDHPKTGERVFFNQIQLHHIDCLDPVVRTSLLSLFSEDDLPRHVYFGDCSPIDAAVVDAVRELSWRTAVKFRWREGDILMVDNMLTAHARLPYTGARKIVVAMGEMIDG